MVMLGVAMVMLGVGEKRNAGSEAEKKKSHEGQRSNYHVT